MCAYVCVFLCVCEHINIHTILPRGLFIGIEYSRLRIFSSITMEPLMNLRLTRCPHYGNNVFTLIHLFILDGDN